LVSFLLSVENGRSNRSISRRKSTRRPHEVRPSGKFTRPSIAVFANLVSFAR
jgi:hypothetical protein